MSCPKCGHELTPALLTIVGTTFVCRLCLGCNHLFLRGGTAHNTKQEAVAREDLAPATGIPLAETCPLTAEEEAEARRLLEA
ncbi:MAG: hypothetical protein ACM3ZC_05510 [Bacteroidota bacterium]